MKKSLLIYCISLFSGLTLRKFILIALGAAICSFGIHNIHQRTGITEGGVIGLMLLLEHWFSLSPAFITPVLDILCYLLAFRCFGKKFLLFSMISTVFVSLFYELWEILPFVLPDLSAVPLTASVLGGIFVGVGVGLIVRQGGSSGGDDALALSVSRLTRWNLSRAYLLTDFTVLALSLSYISILHIGFSLVTVTVSSFLIERIHHFTFATNK